MAELPSLFDALAEQDDPFAAIPDSWQVATIKDSAVAENKKGTGKYLRLTFTINGGDYDGRTVTTYLNVQNESKIAEQIAKRELQALCKAIEVESVKDTAVLHGKPMRIKLKKTPPTGTYGEGNSVIAYASMDDVNSSEDESDPFAA